MQREGDCSDGRRNYGDGGAGGQDGGEGQGETEGEKCAGGGLERGRRDETGGRVAGPDGQGGDGGGGEGEAGPGEFPVGEFGQGLTGREEDGDQPGERGGEGAGELLWPAFMPVGEIGEQQVSGSGEDESQCERAGYLVAGSADRSG